jgi:hypothetical protein
MRSAVLLVLCLALYLSVSEAYKPQLIKSDHSGNLRHVRAPNVVDNLANPSDNKVINFDLGHYFFYYGANFATGGSEATVPPGVQQYMTDISGSDYLNIVSQYSGPVGTNTSNLVHWVGQNLVGTPFGTSIGGTTETCAFRVVERLIFEAGLGVAFDSTVQYYVIFGTDIDIVDDKNGCNDGGACGVHNELKRKINGVDTSYLAGWVKNAPGCIGEQVSSLTSPNADTFVQNVVDTLSHEVAETLTDPYQLPSTARAWNDAEGAEIGDKCSTSYQPIFASTKKTGAYYNVLANGNEYMLQGQWSNEISGCTESRAGGTASSTGVSTAVSPAAGPSLPTVTPTPSPAGTPSAFGALPSSACITCPRTCKRYRKFKNVCKRYISGNFSHPSTNQLCCNNIAATVATFQSFSWSVNAINCEYAPSSHKLQDLCVAIGGRVTCSVGSLGAVRLTCNH